MESTAEASHSFSTADEPLSNASLLPIQSSVVFVNFYSFYLFSVYLYLFDSGGKTEMLN